MSKYGLNQEKIEHLIGNVSYHHFGETTTVCAITLTNGFTVTGTSGCVDPNNFDETIGRKVAYDNAAKEIWAVAGYLEKQRWYEETQFTPKQRVEKELLDLDEKRSKLIDFLEKGKPDNISLEQWALLKKQNEVMSSYALILQERLAKW